ncbi:MAG TPA: efflux RND transporter periplasmic adaptor subunit [Chthonomonadaceae bacterium]|nr:efflux RND transporter periplasmic adaptor subunit [Chthonomonadaceae bacterium]
MKRWIFLFVITIALGGIVIWRFIVKTADAAQQAKVRDARLKAPSLVDVTQATTREIVHTFVGVGTAEAPLNAKIAARITGRIEYLKLREGDGVHGGPNPDVLVRIDPTQLQAQVGQQQAALAEARSRLAQAVLTQDPTNVNVITQIAQQEAALKSARADANQVKQNYASQVAAAQSAVVDAQGRVDNANAGIANAQSAIRSAQANLDNARTRYNRTLELYNQAFVASQDVDDARTTVSIQQGNLEVAQGQLKAAQSLRDSAVAQRDSAQKQADIAVIKGKADIAAAEAKVDQAVAALQYARSNTAQTGAYKENLAALRAAVQAAQGQLDDYRSQLSETVLVAPMDGVVTARYFDPGSVVTPGQSILVIQDIHKIFVTVPIPEELSRTVTVGKPADVVFDALAGSKFHGVITYVTPASDPMSRQFSARVTLDNPDGVIRPGMFARVSLVSERISNVVVLPREAVQQSKDGPYVVVVGADSVAHRRNVRTGAEDPAGIAILEGIRPGERVVMLSMSPVKDGVQVKINNAGQTGTGSGTIQGDNARNAP